MKIADKQDSDWRYYLPESGEVSEDAVSIPAYPWRRVLDAKQAAQEAAEDEWDNRDGWEGGMGIGPEIVVIAPDGTETRFSLNREAQVDHSVRQIT